MLENLPLICIDIIAQHMYKSHKCESDRAKDAASLMLVGNNYCTELAKELFSIADPGCIEEIADLQTNIENINTIIKKKTKNETLKEICRNFKLKISGNKKELEDRINALLDTMENDVQCKKLCPCRKQYRCNVKKEQYEKKKTSRRFVILGHVKNMFEICKYSNKFRCKYEEFVDDNNSNNNSGILKDIIAIATRFDRLKNRLVECDCVLRNDSVMCKRYIENGEYGCDRVVDIMVEMRFFYNHTAYRTIREEMYRYNRYTSPEKLSHMAKEVALKLWRKSANNNSDLLLLPNTLKLSLLFGGRSIIV